MKEYLLLRQIFSLQKGLDVGIRCISRESRQLRNLRQAITLCDDALFLIILDFLVTSVYFILALSKIIIVPSYQISAP